MRTVRKMQKATAMWALGVVLKQELQELKEQSVEGTNRADCEVCVEFVGWLDLTEVGVIVDVICCEYGTCSTDYKNAVSEGAAGTYRKDRADEDYGKCVVGGMDCG